MKASFLAFAILIMYSSYSQQVISLYKGPAPGSENWNWEEKTINVNNMTICLDVSKPTLIAYQPVNPNGTAIIIAPGGAFHALAMDHEGIAVAKWMNERGITAFVLKYRLSHDDPAHPENSFMKLMETRNFKKLDSINATIIPLAMQDGLTAIKYVRQNSAAYKIDPNRIGFMGFSAGGTVTLSVVYNATQENRPNFIAPIYAYASAAIGSSVPKEKTPVFLVVASDDEFGFAPQSLQIYSKWLEAKQPAELHVYGRGGHGFGMKKQNLPVDTWIQRFEEWLVLQGLLNK